MSKIILIVVTVTFALASPCQAGHKHNGRTNRDLSWGVGVDNSSNFTWGVGSARSGAGRNAGANFGNTAVVISPPIAIPAIPITAAPIPFVSGYSGNLNLTKEFCMANPCFSECMRYAFFQGACQEAIIQQSKDAEREYHEGRRAYRQYYRGY